MDINRITEALVVNVDEKLDCVLPCYKIDNHHYIVFWDELVHKDDIEVILHWVDNHEKLFSSSNGIGIFSDILFVIVLGGTDEDFKKAELLYGNGNGLNVLFLGSDFRIDVGAKTLLHLHLLKYNHIPLGTILSSLFGGVDSIW